MPLGIGVGNNIGVANGEMNDEEGVAREELNGVVPVAAVESIRSRATMAIAIITAQVITRTR
jgi:hypothetical protein